MKYGLDRISLVTATALNFLVPVVCADAQVSPLPATDVNSVTLPSSASEKSEPTPTPDPSQPLQPNPDEVKPGKPEPRVLVTEVVVSGVEGALQDEVYKVVKTKPGKTITRSQLQADINAVFATGDFAKAQINQRVKYQAKEE